MVFAAKFKLSFTMLLPSFKAFAAEFKLSFTMFLPSSRFFATLMTAGTEIGRPKTLTAVPKPRVEAEADAGSSR